MYFVRYRSGETFQGRWINQEDEVMAIVMVWNNSHSCLRSKTLSYNVSVHFNQTFLSQEKCNDNGVRRRYCRDLMPRLLQICDIWFVRVASNTTETLN